MKLFFTVTKKGIILTLIGIIILFFIFFWSFSLKLTAIDGSTHQKRAVFIKGIGYEIDDENITSKDTFIPENFGDVYENYNRLQKESGFDLSGYKGKKVTVYTYRLLQSDKLLNLIVYEGKIIGGDISSTALNGEMKPLKK